MYHERGERGREGGEGRKGGRGEGWREGGREQYKWNGRFGLILSIIRGSYGSFYSGILNSKNEGTEKINFSSFIEALK